MNPPGSSLQSLCTELCKRLCKQPLIWTVYVCRLIEGFPGGSVVKNPPANAGDSFDPWVRKILWRRKWWHSPVLLPGKSLGQRNLGGYSPQGLKRQTQLSNWTMTPKTFWVQGPLWLHSSHTHWAKITAKTPSHPFAKFFTNSGDFMHHFMMS